MFRKKEIRSKVFKVIISASFFLAALCVKDEAKVNAAELQNNQKTVNATEDTSNVASTEKSEQTAEKSEQQSNTQLDLEKEEESIGKSQESIDKDSKELNNVKQFQDYKKDDTSTNSQVLTQDFNQYEADAAIEKGVVAPLEGTTIYQGKDYSAVYDFDYYINNNPDVYAAFGYDDEKVLKHFVEFGMNEGRRASKNFDEQSYRYAYPDLRVAFKRDHKKYYLHYIDYGQREGRKYTTGVTKLCNPVTRVNGFDYSKVYDYDYYINRYQDLKKAFGDDDVSAILHFYNYGMQEERQANETFDEKSYRYQYQDLRLAYTNRHAEYYKHYIKYGCAEGRQTSGTTELQNIITKINGVDYSKVYDFKYYINRYPDLQKAFGLDDDASAIKHFFEHGMQEQRRGNETFDVRSYRYQYRDLRAAYRNNYKLYYRHYVYNGAAEGRNTSGVTKLQNPVTVYKGVDLSPIYDYYYYSTKHPDLIKALGDDDYTLLDHFGGVGIVEGRVAKANYNPDTYSALKEKLHPTPVASDPMYYIAQGYSSPSQYLILVDRSRHQVGIFSGGKGNWHEQDYFLCGDGKASTPTVEGVFHIINKKPYFDSGSARCWYATRIYRGYLFHSVLYSQTPTPKYIKDGRLGVGVSHGCVRLDINKAKWIYDNVPIGTTVVIYS
ncbi:L,D-transpeptidase catalytic domain [Lachnospiraceae bacterium C7]|nr:L,D-transpeptidase catalytic domain [Lachnospiraceae bacterium C7]